MISFISGKIALKDDKSAIIERQGLGFEVFLSKTNLDKINIGVFNPEGVRCLQEDENIELYVFYVRAAGK